LAQDSARVNKIVYDPVKFQTPERDARIQILREIDPDVDGHRLSP
tara:strand:+ start:277 stop:411 length:135 start_codon:yes stop_codon:yes gene_type:complete